VYRGVTHSRKIAFADAVEGDLAVGDGL
jgi:hypothetical protein